MSEVAVVLANSKKLKDRDRFISSQSLRGTITDLVLYNELLAQETYPKLICFENGHKVWTTAPITVVYPQETWTWFKVSDKVCIATPAIHSAKKKCNYWWATLRNGQQEIPHLYGDLVVFQWASPLAEATVEALPRMVHMHYNF